MKNRLKLFLAICGLLGVVLLKCTGDSDTQTTQAIVSYTQHQVDSLLALRAVKDSVITQYRDRVVIKTTMKPIYVTVHDTVSYNPKNIIVQTDSIPVEIPYREYFDTYVTELATIKTKTSVVGELAGIEFSEITINHQCPTPIPTECPSPPKGFWQKIKYLFKK